MIQDCFGGQSHPDFDNVMGEYVEPTRREIVEEMGLSISYALNAVPEYKWRIVEQRVEKHVRQAMQGVCYNLNTMHSRAGQLWAVVV